MPRFQKIHQVKTNMVMKLEEIFGSLRDPLKTTTSESNVCAIKETIH
jgi:hypothetical protein